MNRINLTKYGFIRSPENDFSDDGNRFTCYKVGRIRVSKLVADGRVYISASLNGNLEYEEYSLLPHYRDTDRLNGVDLFQINEVDLILFFEQCQAYEKEYTEAENKIVYPTIEEIKAKCIAINEVRKNEFAEISSLATVDKILSLNEYSLSSFKRYYECLKNRAAKGLDPETYPASIYKTRYSRSFIKNNYELNSSYDYRELKNYLQKA